MKKPEYISPSGLSTWLARDTDYYLNYLSDYRPPREAQTQPMSVGSAFDAFVKSYLHEAIYGVGNDPRYELRTIFEAQVEKPLWDWAWTAGMHCFGCYKDCGALADLMIELEGAAVDPRFEVEIRGVVSGTREGVTRHTLGVPLLGKPDIFFINKDGAHVIFDWKVNGYCAKSPKSPMGGYKICRDASPNMKASKNNRQSHKDYIPLQYKGMEINGGTYLEYYDESWARQLATYGWLLGEQVGSEIIVGIDQLCASPNVPVPDLRIASHRSRISDSFQFLTIAAFQELWHRITSGHFFAELTKEESDLKCQALDEQSRVLYHNPDATPAEKWFAENCR